MLVCTEWSQNISLGYTPFEESIRIVNYRVMTKGAGRQYKRLFDYCTKIYGTIRLSSRKKFSSGKMVLLARWIDTYGESKSKREPVEEYLRRSKLTKRTPTKIEMKNKQKQYQKQVIKISKKVSS